MARRFIDNNDLWNNGDIANRITKLKELENLPVDSTWENRPTNPDLCLVSGGLINIFNSIISQWTFQPSESPNISSDFRSVFFSDPMNGWVVGTHGTIEHTTDGGNTWTLQSSGDI